MGKDCISCGSCGMPLTQAEDFALSDMNSSFCKHCVDDKGKLLDFEKILKGTAKFYVDSQGINLETATQMAKEMLLEMPVWKKPGRGNNNV